MLRALPPASLPEERGNIRQRENHSDEITLRDEIFKLKQEMMILKRTNEQYLVKLRKYEDEVKRKDKHLEQLMDPRKNSDLTKVLSTKGAAILMNLRDENNSLIHTILNKDLHIRRLAAQVKMSKLYASTRKNEGYRAEITRLRNLLIKSQETLKENMDVEQQTRSICVSGNSLLEFSSSSDQSSPRDLEELRVTILNLESHIKYSNDLLAEKNQKISFLTDELNFLRKFLRCKTSRNKAFDYDFADSMNYKFSTPDLTNTLWPDQIVPAKKSNRDVFGLLDKNESHENENVPHSAPATFPKSFPKNDSILERGFQLEILEQKRKNEMETKAESAKINPKQDSYEIVVDKTISPLGKSLFHNLATGELKKEEKIFSHLKKEIRTREKWMKALMKCRELKKLNSKISGECEKTEKKNDTPEKFSDGTVQDLEEMVRDNQNQEISKEKQMKSEDLLENIVDPESFIRKSNENGSKSPTRGSDNIPSNVATCQSSAKEISVLYEHEEKSVPKSGQDKERQQVYSDCEKEFPLKFEETDLEREIYNQSLNSSFDSENSYSIKEKVQQVQIEVLITPGSLHNDNDPPEEEFPKNSIFEYSKENVKNHVFDRDFSDDDDVIFREK